MGEGGGWSSTDGLREESKNSTKNYRKWCNKKLEKEKLTRGHFCDITSVNSPQIVLNERFEHWLQWKRQEGIKWSVLWSLFKGNFVLAFLIWQLVIGKTEDDTLTGRYNILNRSYRAETSEKGLVSVNFSMIAIKSIKIIQSSSILNPEKAKLQICKSSIGKMSFSLKETPTLNGSHESGFFSIVIRRFIFS